MNPRLLILLLAISFQLPVHAQVQDSLPSGDTVVRVKDTAARARTTITKSRDTVVQQRDTVVQPTDTVSVSKRVLDANSMFPAVQGFPTVYGPWVGGYMKANERFNVTAPVKRVPMLLRVVENRDWIFYYYCSLLLLVAFVNLAFRKYFVDVFRVFFNTSMRGKQLREQLLQTPLPSLLLNLVFFLSGGAFIFFILRHYGMKTGYHPAVEILLAVALLAAVYLGKFIFVSMLGWMFDRRQAAEGYLFTVFLVNKVAGLVLLLMGLFMAYGDAGGRTATLTLTILLLSLLLLMRLTKGFMAISGLKINVIQFLVFVGAFEVIPALLIYKVLLRVIV